MKTKLSVVFLSMASKPASPVTRSPRGAGLVRTLGWAASSPSGNLQAPGGEQALPACHLGSLWKQRTLRGGQGEAAAFF